VCEGLDCHLPIDVLARTAQRFATRYASYFPEDEPNSVEAWAATSDFVATVTNNNTDSYMNVMDRVFGHQGDGLHLEGETSRDCFLCGIYNEDGSKVKGPTGLYNEFSVEKNDLFKNSGGFRPEFQDPDSTNNQVNHSHYWLQVGYYHGPITGYGGNFWHETFQEDDYPAPGKSVQDYLAGNAAVTIGNALYKGWISPQDVGTRIRIRFGN
jgi:hypothetical protein